MAPPPATPDQVGRFLDRSRRNATRALFGCAAGWKLAITWAVFTDAQRLGPLRVLALLLLSTATTCAYHTWWKARLHTYYSLDRIAAAADDYLTPRNGARTGTLRPVDMR